MTNRRGFLGLLAHLPLVGVLFRGCGQEDEHPVALIPGVDYWIDPDQGNVRWINWIPVSERLPNDPYSDDSNVTRTMLVTDGNIVWVSSFFTDRDNWGWVNHNSVTHWAEMPAPPLPPTDNATGIYEYRISADKLNRSGLIILDGHMRVEAAKAVGWPMEMQWR